MLLYVIAFLNGLPRASGGVSQIWFSEPYLPQSSPRKRGCFLLVPVGWTLTEVFPAQAGVFLLSPRGGKWMVCLPRASGGVSISV